MGLFRAHRGKVVFAVLLIGALLAWFSARQPGDSPAVPKVAQKTPETPAGKTGSPTSFDFYLLALTMHAAFCADSRPGTRECSAGGHRPLVIHGLWPERLEPRTWPHDCPAPALDLDDGLEQQLADFMPGMQSGLHEHEWREHGGCSGLDDDLYFGRTLELARGLDAALAARLTTLAGRDTSAAELRETAELFSPGIGASFTLHCRQLHSDGRPVLVEIRQCVDNDGAGGAPGTLLDCAKVNRRDTGCGSSFLILERG
jgi:ribonuclease T2